MKPTALRQLIDRSGKKRVVAYEGKDKRKVFDESHTQKKMQIISDFIGGNNEGLSKVLSR